VDAVAATLTFALQNPEDRTAKEWLAMFDSSSAIDSSCMFPDPQDADVTTLGGARNKALFLELVKRCREGRDLLKNIEDFINFEWVAIALKRRSRRRRPKPE
jgi:hypothetical protein